MYTVNLTKKNALYILPRALFIGLYPERDHTKPDYVWHDTLAATQHPNGPANVSVLMADGIGFILI